MYRAKLLEGSSRTTRFSGGQKATSQRPHQPRGEWASTLRGAGTEGSSTAAPATADPTAPLNAMYASVATMDSFKFHT